MVAAWCEKNFDGDVLAYARMVREEAARVGRTGATTSEDAEQEAWSVLLALSDALMGKSARYLRIVVRHNLISRFIRRSIREQRTFTLIDPVDADGFEAEASAQFADDIVDRVSFDKMRADLPPPPHPRYGNTAAARAFARRNWINGARRKMRISVN